MWLPPKQCSIDLTFETTLVFSIGRPLHSARHPRIKYRHPISVKGSSTTLEIIMRFVQAEFHFLWKMFFLKKHRNQQVLYEAGYWLPNCTSSFIELVHRLYESGEGELLASGGNVKAKLLGQGCRS